MVMTDGVHLMGTDMAELHKTAAALGLRREWFQPHPRHPHYDIKSERIREKATMCRSIVMLESTRDLLRLLPKLKLADLWDRYFRHRVRNGEPPNAPWEPSVSLGSPEHHRCHFCGGDWPAHDAACVYLAARVARAERC